MLDAAVGARARDRLQTPIGPLHAAGISLDFSGAFEAAGWLAWIGWLTWNSEPNPVFLAMWGIVVLALIAADLVQQRLAQA